MSVQLKHLNTFVKFAAKEMKLPTLPRIHFVGSSENKKSAFGHSVDKDIYIRITGRHPIDVMRTIAHELMHFKQNLLGNKGEKMREDQANALAGRLMRKFDTTHPEVFRDRPINETESGMAANAAGTGAVEGIGVGPKGEPGVYPKKKLRAIIGPMLKRKQ